LNRSPESETGIMKRYTQEALSEELLAELARAAYQVALEHGLRGPFIDAELAIWQALREAAQKTSETISRCSLEAVA
jgi:hypothetical protein